MLPFVLNLAFLLSFKYFVTHFFMNTVILLYLLGAELVLGCLGPSEGYRNLCLKFFYKILRYLHIIFTLSLIFHVFSGFLKNLIQHYINCHYVM